MSFKSPKKAFELTVNCAEFEYKGEADQIAAVAEKAVAELRDKLDSEYKSAAAASFPDEDIFMAIAGDIGFDATGKRMNPGDNPPVGIVLGSDRDEAVIRYTLNEHERNLFAVKYHLNLPTEEELRRELQRERAAFEEARLLAAPQKEARARIRKGKK